MFAPSSRAPHASQAEPLALIAQRMQRRGQWSPAQAAARRWTMGCVALEITQRCNLDCSLSHLFDSAEAVRDIPLAELFRRIDDIAVQLGPNTDVQISGGDPTLRDRAELSQIVRDVRARGLRASLFTNGILRNRDWLQQLARGGLNDVAFHVDMTQQRWVTALKARSTRRLQYIDMARGLRDTSAVVIERGQGLRSAWALAKRVLAQRHLWGGFARHPARMFWQARGEWVPSTGLGLQVPPVRKISFFTHNFMDACNRETDRIDACVFMAATVDGLMSIRAYNAERDHF